jgi:hypothetical protein
MYIGSIHKQANDLSMSSADPSLLKWITKTLKWSTVTHLRKAPNGDNYSKSVVPNHLYIHIHINSYMHLYTYICIIDTCKYVTQINIYVYTYTYIQASSKWGPLLPSQSYLMYRDTAHSLSFLRPPLQP